MATPISYSAAERRQAGAFCVIPSLSTFLIGLYFGQSLPPGVDLVVLQTGLIGMLAFMGLTFQATNAVVIPSTETETESDRDSQRSWYVERRLDRHVDQPKVHSRPLAELRDLISRASSVGNEASTAHTDSEPATS